MLEGVEIAAPGHHGFPGQLDQGPPLPGPHLAHRLRGTKDLPAEVRPAAIQRPGAVDDRGAGVAGMGPVGHPGAGSQDDGNEEIVEELLPRRVLHPERLEPADQEGGVGLVGPLERGQPLRRGQVQRIQGQGLGVGKHEEEHLDQAVAGLEFGPVDGAAVRPAGDEPAGGGPVERVVGGGALDPAVGECPAVPPEVAPLRELRQHGLGAAENRGVVGIGAEEAEDLVEPEHLARAGEAAGGELPHERELLPGDPVPVDRLQRLQPPEQSRRALPLGHPNPLGGHPP